MKLRCRLAVVLLALSSSLPAAAGGSATDLVARAKSNRPPGFPEVLDARFDPSGKGRYEAFKSWVLHRPLDEQSRWSGKLALGVDDKPRGQQLMRCASLDSRGLAHAMIVVADSSADRSKAEATWAEVERAHAYARQMQEIKVAAARKAAKKRPTTIGVDLVVRVAIDQAWREAMFAKPHGDKPREAIGFRLASRLCHIDEDNTEWLKSVLTKGRWPLISRDGEDAAHDAWLLAQHADGDPAFQKLVLVEMDRLVPKQEAKGEDYAYLFDRVARAEGRPQRFATQFTLDPQGCALAQPTEDSAHVDERRAAMGMTTIAEYAKMFAEAYHSKICQNLFKPLPTEK